MLYARGAGATIISKNTSDRYMSNDKLRTMIKFYNLMIGIAFISVFSGCDENEKDFYSSNIEYVKYGNSFGECLGYCINDITVTDSKIIFHKSGWDLDGILPEKSKTENIDNYFWTKLNNRIEFDSFLRLDSIIGCPDCADGGAEWIEIKSNDESYKVVFEYRNEPKEVEGYIGYLRTFINTFQIDSNEDINFNERTFIDQHGFVKNFVATRGSYQFLISIINDYDTSYYFDKFLDNEYQEDNLKINFNGVLQYDSTMIYKSAPNDIPIPDFKARNIKICDMEIYSE